MPSFKTDVSFLEKISIGAIGTRKVFEDLKRKGHTPIELERGSMNYKLWKKIKIKRIRVPDILCVDCGVRIESRAKTKLQISMSHSLSDPERGWDAGLQNNDYVALVACEKVGERPIDWMAHDPVQYVSVKDLRGAVKKQGVSYVKPKGAEEGFEARITWPSAVASSDGVLKKVTKEVIQYSRAEDERTITLQLRKQGLTLVPLVKEGERISRNQVIASIVPLTQSFPSTPVDVNFYITNLSSTNLSERYAAAKALSLFRGAKVVTALSRKLADSKEHIYVKLEAAATLARLGVKEGYDFIGSCLRDSYLQNVLEAVIVLAEIKAEQSADLLSGILLDESQDAEIRAGAAWGLGELGSKLALDALTESFVSVDLGIRIEATRALAKLTKEFSPDLLDRFRASTPTSRPGIAWALTKSGSLTLDQLIGSLIDEDSRKWISYIIGVQGEERYVAEIEKLKSKDPQVYFAVTVLWKIMTSWVYNLNEY